MDIDAAECGCEPGSVIPSDYCYNRTNDGVKPSWPIFFELVGDGEYRFLGRDYPYNGPRWHHPKGGGEPRQVAVWVNGVQAEAAE
ncbi:MAG TPA: hypothetical protein VH092_04940 [Urbifossiella sp.]|jgi:hypothetical protein|nr:hypothetical protein [Urbifossiella sp.]